MVESHEVVESGGLPAMSSRRSRSKSILPDKPTRAVDRKSELSMLTRDQLRDWALGEVHRALERESVRAVHAARLDTVIRLLMNRLHQIAQQETLDVAVQAQLYAAIRYHEKLWNEATA